MTTEAAMVVEEVHTIPEAAVVADMEIVAGKLGLGCVRLFSTVPDDDSDLTQSIAVS
jgi:hypothetical protein